MSEISACINWHGSLFRAENESSVAASERNNIIRSAKSSVLGAIMILEESINTDIMKVNWQASPSFSKNGIGSPERFGDWNGIWL